VADVEQRLASELRNTILVSNQTGAETRTTAAAVSAFATRSAMCSSLTIATIADESTDGL